MGADPDPRGRHLTQQSVQAGTILASHDGIYPDEDAIELKELMAHLIHHVIAEHHGFGRNLGHGQGLEDWSQPVVFRSRFLPRVAVAAPQKADPPDPTAHQRRSLLHIDASPHAASRRRRNGTVDYRPAFRARSSYRRIIGCT